VWVANRFQPQWSGILIVDGKWIPVYDWTARYPGTFGYTPEQLKRIHYQTLIWGIDSGTGDIPAHLLADSEGKVDSVLFFERLQEAGYPLHVLVTDGNTDLITAAQHVYGYPVLWQQCTKHFVEQLWSLSRTENPSKLVSTNGLIRHIQAILRASTFEESYCLFLAYFAALPDWTSPIQGQIIQLFSDHLDSLLCFAEHAYLPIPRTNNAIENLNRQLEMRLHTINQFHSHRNARDYLNLWSLWRRFTPFTDCKPPRQNRNGKSPLQLAGVNSTKLDFLNL
jgi:hypothetical protein